MIRLIKFHRIEIANIKLKTYLSYDLDHLATKKKKLRVFTFKNCLGRDFFL